MYLGEGVLDKDWYLFDFLQRFYHHLRVELQLNTFLQLMDLPPNTLKRVIDIYIKVLRLFYVVIPLLPKQITLSLTRKTLTPTYYLADLPKSPIHKP